MIIDDFLEDFKTYTLKTKTSQRNEIWQVSTSTSATSSIVWLVVKLKNPREISGTFKKIVSEYAFYSKQNYSIKNLDIISDWINDFEVIESVMTTWLWWDSEDKANIVYLQLIK